MCAASSTYKHACMRPQVTIEDYMSEFEGGTTGPAPGEDPQLAAQLSGPWMKALLADEEEAAGTDLFSKLAPSPAPPQPQPQAAPGEANTQCLNQGRLQNGQYH